MPQRKGSSSNHHFPEAMLNFGGVGVLESSCNSIGWPFSENPCDTRKTPKKNQTPPLNRGEFDRGFYLVMFVTVTPWEFSGIFPPVVVASEIYSQENQAWLHSGKGSQSLYAQHARGGLGQDLCALRAGAIVMKTVDIHPWRLTWNIIMEVWKIMFLSKWVICRFHVNLPECIHWLVSSDSDSFILNWFPSDPLVPIWSTGFHDNCLAASCNVWNHQQ